MLLQELIEVIHHSIYVEFKLSQFTFIQLISCSFSVEEFDPFLNYLEAFEAMREIRVVVESSLDVSDIRSQLINR